MLLRCIVPTIFITFLIFFSNSRVTYAKDAVLRIDVRHRPPEMVVSGETYTGPLIDIIKEAAEKNNYTVIFQSRQFNGSLALLKQGFIDILPRTICTIERAVFIDYLGPIGYQEKDIVFIVRKGQEKSISSFEDLKKFNIGTKLGTHYFDAFNNSTEINKIETADDKNLVSMFSAQRFDAFIVLDQKAAEAALAGNGVTEYAYAVYKHINRIGNFYGITPGHPAHEKLQHTIEKMVLSGRIKELYKKHGASPPVFTKELGFKNCFD